MDWTMHDVEHCWCSRCERLRKSEARRFLRALVIIGALVGAGTFFAFHVVLWVARVAPWADR